MLNDYYYHGLHSNRSNCQLHAVRLTYDSIVAEARVLAQVSYILTPKCQSRILIGYIQQVIKALLHRLCIILIHEHQLHNSECHAK